MGLTKGRIGGSDGGIRMLCSARRRRRRAFSSRSREHSASADSNKAGWKVLPVISAQNSSKDWQLAKGTVEKSEFSPLAIKFARLCIKSSCLDTVHWAFRFDGGVKQMIQGLSDYVSLDPLLSCFLAFAFFIRTFAAALDALIALSRRCFGVRALARARPPCLASSERTLRISSSSMCK